MKIHTQFSPLEMGLSQSLGTKRSFHHSICAVNVQYDQLEM